MTEVVSDVRRNGVELGDLEVKAMLLHTTFDSQVTEVFGCQTKDGNPHLKNQQASPQDQVHSCPISPGTSRIGTT